MPTPVSDAMLADGVALALAAAPPDVVVSFPQAASKNAAPPAIAKNFKFIL
ncbi:MAG TPA: hypothetical protein VIN39_08100 [Candidatus Dormibacteraeota bacterium]